MIVVASQGEAIESKTALRMKDPISEEYVSQ
jgi:hypothetical protein